MRLLIQKGQREKGMMSKTIMFQLTVKAELTPEEQATLHKYNLGREIIYAQENISPTYAGRNTWSGIARNLAATALNLRISCNCLVMGRQIECASVAEMLDVEQTIIDSSRVMSALLDACANFGGQQVIEI